MTTTWFITGASRGLGRVWAEAALERGDRVAATARDLTALDDLAERYGDRVLPLWLDVTDREGAFAAVAEADERFGGLDVVVNGAGFGHFAMVEELTEPELRAQMEANFFGTVWVTQAAVAVMRRQGHGHLLQVTSEGGLRSYPGIGAYHASKWAVEGLSEALRLELAPLGVDVTCVEPGPYETGFADSVRRSATLAAYDEVRRLTAPTFEVGQASATVPAIMQLVDSDSPPARLILGRLVPTIAALYEERVRTWRAWEPVSEAAFGTTSSSVQL